MDKKEPPSADFNSQLTSYRQQIDELDDKLMALLKERMGIIQQVGELKRKHVPGACPLRPGREADMVRRVIGKFEGSHFSPAAAAAIWRLLIGFSTSLEAPLRISVYNEQTSELYWLAREYFGSFLPIIRQPQIKRVIGDVMDGKAAIGLVPMLRSTDTTYWWTNLLQPGSDIPKIFAHVPFVYSEESGKDIPAGLAIAKVAPEQTENDMSVIVLEADHNVSQHRLQGAFAQAKLEANWINIATLHPTARHHLLEIKGFITPDHEQMKAFLSALGASILQVTFLGAYATPINLPSAYPQKESGNLHANRPFKL